MPTELQINSWWQLRKTLLDLSSAERQRKYKNAVPFVHVPEELLEQWSNHSRMLREVPWFRSLFTSEQAMTLTGLNLVINRAFPRPRDIPDIPEALDDPAWQDVMKAALNILPRLPVSLETD